MPGFHSRSGTALWVPKGTPKDVVAKLNAAVRRRVGRSGRASNGSPTLGQEIPPRDQQTPEALRAHQKAEIEKWWPIIKAANIEAVAQRVRRFRWRW